MSTEPRTPGLRRAAGHAHDHGGPLRLAPGESRRVRIVLAALVVPLVLATLLGIAVLWPGRVEAIGSQPFAAEGASLATARVTATQVSSCAESAASLGGISDGSLLGDAVCAEITSGEGRGLVVPVHVPAESLPAAQVGDRMRVMYTAQALAGGTPYVFVDYDRQLPVGALAVAYLVLVVAVAGLKGLRAVLGLVLATGVLLRFMIPALLALHPPLLVTLVGSVAMMLLAVYVAHDDGAAGHAGRRRHHGGAGAVGRGRRQPHRRGG